MKKKTPGIRDVPEVDAQVCPPESRRPLQVKPPEVSIDFKEWQAVISKNFPAYARPAEICASVVTQLLLNDAANPFARIGGRTLKRRDHHIEFF